ncbi:MAG TPA: endonuclease/exonuclease/phosphatase family protein [Kofleriaceae bacterium]
MKHFNTSAIMLCAAIGVAGACTDDTGHETLDQEIVPAGWSELDINASGGSTAYDASTGTLALTTSGGAVSATADSFRFVYRPWTGDGVVIARLAELTPGTDWSAGGVMIRQSTASNAAHASMIAFSSGKLHFRYRSSAGGGTSTSGPTSGHLPPQWLKVQRVGNVFQGFVSGDGQAWTSIGSTSIAMTGPVLVGIVAFRGGTAPIDATFDGISTMAVGPWASSDVGDVALAGSVSQSGGDYSVRAAGTGVWDVADAFRYTYRPWTGDGEIVARVDSIDAAGAANALGGVMFRESVSSPSSRHAAMLVFANGKAKLRWRSSPGSATGSAGPSSGVAPPRWVRLTRVGNLFTGYHGDSATGPWVGFAGNTATVPMDASVFVGFAAAREGNSALATVRMSGVATGTSTPPPPTKRFKVVSWNLQHSSAGATAQGDLLTGLDADVIITQETHASAATTIRGRLGSTWKVRHFAGTASEGNAVFTRLETPGGVENGEIVGDDRLIGPSTWGGSRYATRITVRLGTTDVSVFVTHLDYPKTGSTWDTHAQNRDLFVAWLDTFAGHKIWGGDLNAKTNGNAIQIATIAAMDARGIDSCRGFFNQTHSWCNTNYWTKSGPTRFDYIYKTSGLTFRSHDVFSGTTLSDHKPVITTVEVP